MIKVGIVGGSGFVAGELMRILLHHPKVNIDFVYSHSNAAQQVSVIHDDFFDQKGWSFTDQVNSAVDVLFLCLGHGHSVKFLMDHKFSDHTKIIDLGNDFRLNDASKFDQKLFTYGLVEANKEKIKSSSFIANPGCFATAIQLALLPLAQSNKLNSDVHVHALTGATGAGKGLSATTHFSWRTHNVSVYKAFKHQHLSEIKETLIDFQKDFNEAINFLPVRGDFTRGIFATIYTNSDLPETELLTLYQDFYQEAPFTFITQKTVHLKQVVNTNKCLLQIQKIDGKVLITSVIDNLIKGAAGQAVQNMNLMFDFEETTGLNLKPSYF